MALVQTSYGALRGTEENGVHVFRGVPFARPPLGALRFRAPEKPAAWQGERDARRYAPASIQANRGTAQLLGIIVDEQSEDCLYLNVWTPALDGARRPVLVWIHGGAWVIGAGSERAYDGTRLARRGDVVVVTINYRLGVFGFFRGRELTGGAIDSSGNEGLLDCIAALEWVRDEIAAFGGDPNNVTVAGESAGSVNIACLLAMPRAKGLFQRAILQSGSLNLARTPEAATAMAQTVLEQFGPEARDADRLRALPAEELKAAMDRALGTGTGAGFSPVADGELLPRDPFKAVADGSARGVPLIVGTNLEEMKLYSFIDRSLAAVDENGLLLRATAVFPGVGPEGRPNGQRAVETYREARSARGEDTSPAEVWLAMATDQVFRIGAVRLAEAQASHTPQTYCYLFAWKASAPGGPQGATHALDLPFVFGTLDESPIGAFAGRTPAARALSDKMQDAWLAFARTGSPRTESLPAWEPYAPPRRTTMVLDADPRLVEAPMEPERVFWESLTA